MAHWEPKPYLTKTPTVRPPSAGDLVFYRCSECLKTACGFRTPFCPWCGFPMEESEPHPVTRQQADNAREMLNGCLNRMYVSDDPEEITRMYRAAVRDVGVIREYGVQKLRGADDERT